MRAVGLSYGRLLRVPYMFAIALALLNFGIVGFVQPLSRHAYEALRFELRSGALGASIKVGEFTNLGKRMTLRIERSLDEGRNLQGIFVRAVGKDGQTVAVRSEERRVGKECVRTCRSRWSAYPYTKKTRLSIALITR